MSIKILIQTIEIERVDSGRICIVDNPDVNLMQFLDEKKTNGYTLLFHNYYRNSRFTSLSGRYPFIIKGGKCEWHVPVEEVTIRDFALTHEIGLDGTILIEEGGVGGWGDVDSYIELLSWVYKLICVYGAVLSLGDIAKRILPIYHKLIGKDGKIASTYELVDFLKTRQEWTLQDIKNKTADIDDKIIELLLLQQGYEKDNGKYVFCGSAIDEDKEEQYESEEIIDESNYEFEELKRRVETLNKLLVVLYIQSKHNNNNYYYIIEKLIDNLINDNSYYFRKGEGISVVELNDFNTSIFNYDSLCNEIDLLCKYIVVLYDSMQNGND